MSANRQTKAARYGSVNKPHLNHLSSVTVATDTVDLAGNPLAEVATTPEIPVTEPVVKQPQNPVQTPIDTPQNPTDPGQQPGDFVDLGYTFTLEGEKYPGFNPSPKLQNILNTHPSAKLPHFEEAVQMGEVMSWVYRKVWAVYPGQVRQVLTKELPRDMQSLLILEWYGGQVPFSQEYILEFWTAPFRDIQSTGSIQSTYGSNWNTLMQVKMIFSICSIISQSAMDGLSVS